jgi:putative ABC transport system permease protein
LTLSSFLARKNLRSDRFATACMVLGVALGTATVNVVLALDVNTRRVEAANWKTNPDLPLDTKTTVSLGPLRAGGQPAVIQDVREETHEDYQVMRSAIRLGSLSAFLVGALIVFFSLAVVIEHRRREVALLRSLGATARQVAGVFVREAAWVGLVGAVLGFLMAFPMTRIAALVGITTTGRSRIVWLDFPLREMLAVSVVGGLTSLLGVLPPVRKILGMSVPETLRPRFLDSEHARAFGRKTSGVTLIVLPFLLLVYGLMRPLFRELVPSLAFFVLEAGLVMLALLALLLLVPDLTRVVGGALGGIFLRGPAAARLLSLSRIRRQGHELAWSVGGIMLVFALLLSLHISTHALKQEIARFGETALRGYAFIHAPRNHPIPSAAIAAIPPEIVVARYSSRTPMPNQVSAVAKADLVALTRATRRPELIEIAERFAADGVILSTLMARRFGLRRGDRLELSSPQGARTLEVTAVTDAIGFIPIVNTYRNSKTYAIVEAATYPLLEPFSDPIGSELVLADPTATEGEPRDFAPLVRMLRKGWNVHTETGQAYERVRTRETDRDFFIFDVILALTTVLAAIGIANQLVLAVHTRRREIALLRVLGMTVDQIKKMLLLEGAFVGLLGGTLAVVLGVPLGLGSLAALKLVSAFEVQFELPLHYVVLTIAGAVAVSVIAALYPARRGASARSAESVHYE